MIYIQTHIYDKYLQTNPQILDSYLKKIPALKNNSLLHLQPSPCHIRTVPCLQLLRPKILESSVTLNCNPLPHSHIQVPIPRTSLLGNGVVPDVIS